MVGDESPGPGGADLVDPVDVTLGTREWGDPVAPIRSDEELEVGLQRRNAGELLADEGRGDGVVAHHLGSALDRVVHEPVLGDQRDVVLARALDLHEIAHEAGVFTARVGIARTLAQGGREWGHGCHGHQCTFR